VRILQIRGKSMGFSLSLIYRLLTDSRWARRRITDRMIRVRTHSRFSKEFFDAAEPHYELQLARFEFSKNRRR
jgi:hypothetical protein